MSERGAVVAAIVDTIAALAGPWEYREPLHADTRLIADLAMASLDIVVLASALTKRYGLIPFDQLYAAMEAMPPEARDLTIGQFADFVYRNVSSTSRPRAARESERAEG